MRSYFLFLSFIFIIMIYVTLSNIEDKLDEVLTNAAECGDIDCDDGYDYAASRIKLEGELRNLYDPTVEKVYAPSETDV